MKEHKTQPGGGPGGSDVGTGGMEGESELSCSVSLALGRRSPRTRLSVRTEELCNTVSSVGKLVI